MRTARASLVATCAAALLVTASGGAATGGSDLRPDFKRAACGYPPFEIDALRGPVGAEREDHPSAAALRVAIGAGLVPSAGPWRLLERSSEIALYGSGNLPRIATAVLTNDSQRGWYLAGSTGGCAPRVIRRGIGASEWRLDPDFRRPRPDDSVLHLLVTESNCASGQPAGERIQKPRVHRGRRALTITYFVEPRRGPQTCQGNPPSAVTLDLGRRLGDRRLLDGQHVVSKRRFP